jgi:ATP-dependent exoDNAse (exonuclease V) beta subunit
MDNQVDHLQSLFCDLLAKRDQWLNIIYLAQNQKKQHFEMALHLIEQDALTHFKKVVPKEAVELLETLVKKAAWFIPSFADVVNSKFTELDSRYASVLAHLLLTKQGTFRKRFDHHVGLKKGLLADEAYYQLKAESESLLATLDSTPDCLRALLRIQRLPTPHYSEHEWTILQALLILLPLLAAHLQMIFNENDAVDFVDLTAQALNALGSMEQPTDLGLYWDYRIKHLLVDEFQDTSLQQFHLLNLLTQGFDQDKSLFVVGDPMQSIYRFRAAEVGLFLRAQREGIGNVALTSLYLSANFRSAPKLVHWVNQHFKSLFPQQDEIALGAVAFHAALPEKQQDDTSEVMAITHENKDDETATLVKAIETTLTTYPNDSVALLVRSRRILKPILKLLNEKNIPYQGKDIILLADIPLMRDVFSLTQALLMPGNRLAWLSVLRSPWCGLSLPDLYQIAGANPKRSIYYTLMHLNTLTALSKDGHNRAAAVFHVLHHALNHRQQTSLIDWLQQTLDAFCCQTENQPLLTQYWQLVSQFEKNGLIHDWTLFTQAFQSRFSEQSAPARLQIMTIHKSKGLEFDTVFIPGLGAKASLPDRPLFRFLQVPTEDHQIISLISPIKAAHEESNDRYDYVAALEAEKEQFELQRLLYVAVTRAKKRLYLSDYQPEPSANSFRSLLKHQTFELQAALHEETPHNHLPRLQRLPTSHALFSRDQSAAVLNNSPPPSLRDAFSFQKEEIREVLPAAHLTGQIIHTLLQWIGEHHPVNINAIPWIIAEQALQKLGLPAETMLMIRAQITAFIQDPIGQWIMQRYPTEHCEYALLTIQDNQVTTRIIDRWFIDQNILWVIDYKTGFYSEKRHQKHQQQLNQYATLLEGLDHYSSDDPGPKTFSQDAESLLNQDLKRQQAFVSVESIEQIKCGIYYLSTNQWLAWTRPIAKQKQTLLLSRNDMI